MSNALSEEQKQQGIALGKLGWSLRKIERETGVRRETAGAYLVGRSGLRYDPGAWRRQAPAKRANEVTPDFVGLLSQPPSSPAGRVSACEPYRDLIEEKLSRGRNAKAVWQDLVTDHGYPGNYQTVKRFVRKLQGSRLPQALGSSSPRQGKKPKSRPLVRDPQTGKYRRTRLFVLTLGYGRTCIRLLTWRSSARIWAELHEKAFRERAVG